MKISGQDPMHSLASYLLGIREKKEGPLTQDAKAASSPSSDNVEISAGAQNYQQVNRIVASTPEVRSDRIAEIQAKIASGADPFQSAQIAEKLIRSTLLDTLL